MPCKGDECCTADSGRRDYESPAKEVTNFPAADAIHSVVNLSSSASPASDHSVPVHRPLTNGHANGDVNRMSAVERRPHPSGLSFEAVSPLGGEELKQDGVADLLNCRAFLSNYRVVIVTHNRQGACSIPIMGVDNVEAFDERLKIVCKDGRVFSVCAETQETAMNWFKLVTPLVCGAHKLQDVFAFRFAISCAKQKPIYLRKPDAELDSFALLKQEFENCGFNEEEWRISKANEDFKICASYPQYLVVPKATSDQELIELKRGRFFDRFPTAVWRSKTTGAVLMRSSQPEVSFFGTPQEGDTRLFEAIRNVTVTDKKQKIVIIDARSYAAAWANRAKGGGFEGGEAYSGTEVSFMSLPNIHSLRYSFHQLRQLLNSNVDGNSYFQALNTSQWFQYLFNLIISSQRCVETMCSEGLSVLVHCSDGWDRTTQIVSLIKVICDPYYRTCNGFEHLIRREWIEFGHKFNDRNGMTSTDTNERSPVFMQFLDAVHQLWKRNPDMFEFNQRYLMKLAQHQYSGMFGTFLFNNYRELLLNRGFAYDAANAPLLDGSAGEKNGVHQHATLISVFDYLGKHNSNFVNPLYDAHKTSRLICPKAMWELQVWREVYCCSDLEGIVNNPDTAYHPIAGESPPHGECLAADKMPTMSRSQSAASLNSLEQSTNGIHCNGALNHTTTNATGTTFAVGSSYSTISYISRREFFVPPGKTYVDVDGLSKVPIDYEDRIIELQRRMMNLDPNGHSGSESSMSREGKREAENQQSVLRHRVESNDSSMFSFDVLEDLDCGRRKRDSTCSSNVPYEVPLRAPTDMISALSEEERCEKCQAEVTDENSAPQRKSGERGVRCDRCIGQVIPSRSNGQVVVS